MTNGLAFGQLFDLFEQVGIFDYILPFLVIFALVYGILVRTKLFKDNNAINGIIALAVGLLSLQFDMVPVFFGQVFPKLAIGLTVILIVIIVLGLFMPQQKWVIYVLFGIAALVLILVLAGSFEPITGGFGTGFQQYTPLIVTIVAFIIIIAIVMGVLSSKDKNQPKFKDIVSPILKDLHIK